MFLCKFWSLVSLIHGHTSPTWIYARLKYYIKTCACILVSIKQGNNSRYLSILWYILKYLEENSHVHSLIITFRLIKIIQDPNGAIQFAKCTSGSWPMKITPFFLYFLFKWQRWLCLSLPLIWQPLPFPLRILGRRKPQQNTN